MNFLIENRESFYKQYSIVQKEGKIRRIQEPLTPLKEIQESLIDEFEKFTFHLACTSRAGGGVNENVAPHINANYVLKIDIKRCYQSITKEKILAAVGNQFDHIIDYCLIRDSKDEEILPTGAPTSPSLCNIALTPIDQEVAALAEKYGYIYTRYFDDLHLSTSATTRDWSLLDKISEIIIRHGYKINKKKTKWLTVGVDKVIITGVRIGGYSPVPRHIKRLVRAVLDHAAREKEGFNDEVQGYLAYVKMLDKGEHKQLMEYYQKRLQKYEYSKRVSSNP